MKIFETDIEKIMLITALFIYNLVFDFVLIACFSV